jgi:hypothetical protein
MLTKSLQPEQSLTAPIGGAHHCIGSSYATVDLAFGHLHAMCAAHGGSLMDADLTAAHATIIESFSSTLDYFERFQKRCMNATDANTQMLFAQGRMLSSVLFVSSQRIAAHCFSLQFNRLGTEWLKLFFNAFSESILRHVCADAETRLARAYVKAAGSLRQRLSIKTFLLEQAVQDVLRECTLPFKDANTCDAMAIKLDDEVNHSIGKQSGSVCPHVSKITSAQMRTFLELFPCEIGIILKSSASAELRNQGVPKSSGVTANCSSI